MMRKVGFWVLGIWLFTIISCAESPLTQQFTASHQADIFAVAELDNISIYSSPSVASSSLETLTAGESFRYAGEITEKSDHVRLDGVSYFEPWVAVFTSKGEIGWVFAGAISIEGEESHTLADLLLHKRIRSFFGDLDTEIYQYRTAYERMKSAKDMAQVFHQGEALREKIVVALERKLPPSQVEQMPNLFWLEKVFPGYIVELVSEGTQYYMFKDFRAWKKKAEQTKGIEDNQFMDLGILAFEKDSIEHFYPSWYWQIWEYGGHSLLGKGIHNKVLAHIDTILVVGTPFETDILAFKKAILRDITHPDMTYWNTQADIVLEIETILKAEYKIFDEKDILSIEKRLKQFKSASSYEIQLNLRTGDPHHI